MKPEEAIDYLLDPIGKREKHDDAIQMAIEALQKQIPQKSKAKELLPDEYVVGHVKIYATPCGNCGEYISTTLWEYCPWCGQAIDYGGDEG